MNVSGVAQQKRFYDTRPHQHLRYVPKSVYATRLVEHLLSTAQLTAASHVLEAGCGAGRFTIPLLERFQGTLVAFDLSTTLLEQLTRQLHMQPASLRARCRPVSGNIYAVDGSLREQRFDAVIAFFFLHHLDDLAGALQQLRGLLRPGGQMIFIEPNRRNPLFLLQVLCCQDMSWSEERGMFTLGRARIRSAFLRAGMSAPTISTFGWFPPQILDRWPGMLRVEERIERLRWCRPVLPFRLIRSVYEM